MQTILVPLDGSALSEQVLPFVRTLAPALHARVVLLHVVTDPEHEYPVTHAPDMPAAAPGGRWAREQYAHWQQHRHEVQAYLAAQAAPLLTAGIAVEYHIETGMPAETIIAAAHQHHASLLALATHSHGRLRRWAMGSVASIVAQHVTIPILLVREGVHPRGDQLRHILAPLDGSVQARHVLAHALALAHSANAELVVLQTLAPSIEDLLGTGASIAARRDMLAASVRQAYATHFGDACASQAHISAVIGLGTPLDALVEETAQRPTDLIVVANPPHTSRRRASHESLGTLLHAAAAPLLIVPAH